MWQLLSLSAIFKASSTEPSTSPYGGKVVIARTLVVVIHAQAELDHATNATRELRGLVRKIFTEGDANADGMLDFDEVRVLLSIWEPLGYPLCA